MSHDLNETLIFVKVVEPGTFIAPANPLCLPNPTASRKVQDLHTPLGARLPPPTTRRPALTDATSLLHQHRPPLAPAPHEADAV